MRTFVPVSVIALCAVMLSKVVQASDLMVPSQYADLQSAHDAALPGDRIVIAPGTYGGQVAVSKSVTFSGPSDGATSCSIGRVTIANAGAQVVIENLRFEGNSAPLSNANGGAVRIQGGTVAIRSCTFVGNSAYEFGGAVFQWSGSSEIFNCLFERNQTGAPSFTYNFGGGAIAAGGGQLNIHHCVFRDNSAGGGNGGAINGGGYGGSFGVFRIWACVFCGGTSERGAAAIHGANAGDGVVFRRCTGGQFAVTGSANSRCVAIDCAVPGAIPCNTGIAGGTCDTAAPMACTSLLDCDLNGVIDVYEVAGGAAADCNSNGTIDGCEIVAGTVADCNHNGAPDSCDIAAGLVSDLNGNGIPDACEAPTCQDADLFRNGVVNGADLGILLSEWGPASVGTASDINRDGRVDGADLGFLLSVWGPCA